MTRLSNAIFSLPGILALGLALHMIPAIALVPLAQWFTPMGITLALLGMGIAPLARMAWKESN